VERLRRLDRGGEAVDDLALEVIHASSEGLGEVRGAIVPRGEQPEDLDEGGDPVPLD
jgi:hypothetical protein